MLIYDVPLFQFAVPVAVVILCVFIVFAFGFKSPGTPPTLDVHDDEEKLQKPKKSSGKKSGKTTDAPAVITNTKQPFVAPKALNNIHNNINNNIKVNVVPNSVEKPQNEQPKLKVKKPAAKKVDDNANISYASEEVGDWTTAVSKKNRKNQSKKKEASTEPLLDSKLGKEIDKEVKEQIVKKEEVEKLEAKEVVPPIEPLVAEEAEFMEVKQKKKQKNKKLDKVEENAPLSESTIAEEPLAEPLAVEVAKPCATTPEGAEKAAETAKVVVEAAAVVDKTVEAAKAVDEATDEGKMEVVKSKKKKKPETRKNFQEVPLPASGVESENGDKSMVQVHSSTATSSKNKSIKVKKEDGKVEKAASPPQEVRSTLLEGSSAPVVLQESAKSEQPPRSVPDDQGEWLQAKPQKRKKQVQREH